MRDNFACLRILLFTKKSDGLRFASFLLKLNTLTATLVRKKNQRQVPVNLPHYFHVSGVYRNTDCPLLGYGIKEITPRWRVRVALASFV